MAHILDSLPENINIRLDSLLIFLSLLFNI